MEIDHAPDGGRQHVDEKRYAEVFRCGPARWRRRKEARSDHQTASHVVGPLHRRVLNRESAAAAQKPQTTRRSAGKKGPPRMGVASRARKRGR